MIKTVGVNLLNSCHGCSILCVNAACGEKTRCRISVHSELSEPEVTIIGGVIGMGVESVQLKTCHSVYSLRVEVAVWSNSYSTRSASNFPNLVIAVALPTRAATAANILVHSATSNHRIHKPVHEHMVDYGGAFWVIVVPISCANISTGRSLMAEGSTSRICEVVLIVHHRWSRFEKRSACLTWVKRGIVNACCVCSICAINFENQFSIGDPVKCAPVGIEVDVFVVAGNVIEQSCRRLGELNLSLDRKSKVPVCSSFGMPSLPVTDRWN